MKELSRVTTVATSPTTLIPGGGRLRLVHDNDEIVFIACPIFRGERVAIRYPVTQIAFAKCQSVATTPLQWGPVLETIQIWRNTQRYGFWDGMAATNLQNMQSQPDMAEVLKIGFLVPGSEFEIHGFMFTESLASKMPLVDCAAYLRSLMIKARRSRRFGHGF